MSHPHPSTVVVPKGPTAYLTKEEMILELDILPSPPQGSISTLDSASLVHNDDMSSVFEETASGKRLRIEQEEEEELSDKERKFRWGIVVAAFFCQVIMIGTISSFGVYQEQHFKDKKNSISTVQFAWLGTLQYASMFLSGLFTSQFADYFGYRISILVGGLIMTTALMAASAFSTPQGWSLQIFQGVLYGLGGSFVFFPSISIPFQWFFSRRGLVTGIVVSGGGIGGLVLSPLIQLLNSSLGYPWTIRIMAFIHLTVLVPLAYLIQTRIDSVRSTRHLNKKRHGDVEKRGPRCSNNAQQSRQDRDTKQGKAEVFSGGHIPPAPLAYTNTTNPTHGSDPACKLGNVLEFTILENKKFQLLVGIALLTALGSLDPRNFMPTYARNYSIQPATVALLIKIMDIASILGRILIGWACDSIGPLNTLFLSTLCTSLSVLTIWMLAGSSMAIIAVYCLVNGFSSASLFVVLTSTSARLCGIHRLASTVGIMFFGVAIGIILSIPARGLILDQNPDQGDRPYLFGVGIVLGIATILSLVLKLCKNPSVFGHV